MVSNDVVLVFVCGNWEVCWSFRCVYCVLGLIIFKESVCLVNKVWLPSCSGFGWSVVVAQLFVWGWVGCVVLVLWHVFFCCVGCFV